MRDLPGFRAKAAMLLSAALLAAVMLPAQETYRIRVDVLPVIRTLSMNDPVFRQIREDLAAHARSRSGNILGPTFLMARYAVKNGDTLFRISASLNIPYGSVASLNRMAHPADLREGQEILIPNTPGLHLPATDETQVDTLLRKRLAAVTGIPYLLEYPGDTGEMTLYVDTDYSTEERSAFMGTWFRPPLDSYRISSVFGPRKNPLTGAMVRHDGLDMVAPRGSLVLAARDGTVAETGFHTVYGKYVVLDHQGGYTTMYGHLDSVSVRKGQKVLAGTALGKLGNTGQSTGPHLHFEICLHGKAVDPVPLIVKKKM